MNPATHFLVGWAVANGGKLERKDRALVAVAGVIPDADGFGMVTDAVTKNWEEPLEWWGAYHHILGHNLTFAVVYCAAAFGLATRRWVTALLAFVAFHLHILGDLIGGRGPDGDQWPMYYLWPFTKSVELVWSGQWELNAWPNFAVTGVLLVITFYLAWKRGYSPVGIVSVRADEAFVATLRARVPLKDEEGGGE